MRYPLGFLLAVAVAATVFFGLGESEAACRAGGEYRVTGPNLRGTLTLTETTSGERSSSGTASLDLYPNRACPVCLIAGHNLTGQYHADAGYDECGVVVTLRLPLDPAPERSGSVGGWLAFGGSVIMFEYYENMLLPNVDLNLTLGIRKDSFVRP